MKFNRSKNPNISLECLLGLINLVICVIPSAFTASGNCYSKVLALGIFNGGILFICGLVYVLTRIGYQENVKIVCKFQDSINHIVFNKKNFHVVPYGTSTTKNLYVYYRDLAEGLRELPLFTEYGFTLYICQSAYIAYQNPTFALVIFRDTDIELEYPIFIIDSNHIVDKYSKEIVNRHIDLNRLIDPVIGNGFSNHTKFNTQIIKAEHFDDEIGVDYWEEIK